MAARRRTTATMPAVDRELLVFRQVFETWWIAVPASFDDCWVAEGGYWHAWDEHRSVSVSSTVLVDDEGRPAPAAEVMDSIGELVQGEPIAAVPPGLRARATLIHTDPDSRASRAVTGMVVVDGRVLIATITSDDVPWAVRIWESIGYRPAPIRASPAARRTDRAGGRLT
jgi:hypothetical protein